MREQIYKILTKANKPSKYIGKEVGSCNKDWDSAEVRAAMAFPDLYEIGISNLGLRILYDKINNYKEKNFLADRVYAPETDFRELLQENNLPLYGVESFKPLNDFDMIAFSLQYELSYPTILAMFEMANIPIKSADRTENNPIIIAGGPGSYNPEPISEFIDLFLIGDGESVIIELLETIAEAKKENLTRRQTLEKLSLIQGVYIPQLLTGAVKINAIKKRIDNIDNTDYPVDFPVPYSTAVHDRAVIEIRRGCGRMCRFCQACFVNFPVRERSPQNVISLVDEVLKNTGYDEYSLLALSSNDYKNIEKLVGVLNDKHACSGVSVSLPSQRADKFSVELAEQVQSVRKSTITIAPEAGSQRLRNVINKNLTEEQILDAVENVFKSGWSNIKLYFMIGLPTETYEDLDAIVELLQKIKNKAAAIKKELNLKKFLSVSCTVSIFVPKPFTPFQWAPQDKLEIMQEKARYLKEKVRPIRDVKLNYHDTFLSQLEAVFARGDKSLNRLIEAAYLNGSYLDAWNEHFNKELWCKTAEILGINFEDYACKEYGIKDELPWDMFDIGVDKSWLAKEYQAALASQNSVPCDESCADCGVCKNFNTSPSIQSQAFGCNSEAQQKSLSSDDNSSLEDSEKNKTKIYAENYEDVHRYRLKLQKINELRFISHLDWQKLLYSAVRKAGLKVNFTQGFNPSPKISLAVALPLFVEGIAEYADIELQENLEPQEIKEKLNTFLPESSKILEIVKISKAKISIDKEIFWAKYTAIPANTEILENIDLKTLVKNTILQENILVDKISKKNKTSKKVNIRPAIHSLVANESNGQIDFILKTGQGICQVRRGDFTVKPEDNTENNPPEIKEESNSDSNIQALRADVFLEYLTPEIQWNVIREELLNENLEQLF
jgi:radical SAM family uncharacterized protein/radical SAM-linked protein